MSQLITIIPENQGQRLDKFLAEVLTDQTRSQIKKMIKTQAILVNGKPTKVHHFLKPGDMIRIGIGQPTCHAVAPSLRGAQAGQPTNLLPKIIFENADFIVLDKPSGLLVHPTQKGETNTLVDWLIKQYPQIATVGEQNYRAGIIHRLDRDVSGILVVAKNNNAFYHLKQQFKKRQVQKEYMALVYGRMENSSGEIDLPIGRSKEGQFVAHPRIGKDMLQNQDKFAKTRFKVLEYIKDYTLLSVQILTGRTHQIRVHLCAVGHPILGDGIYKPKKKFFHFLRRRIKVVDLDRIFLHSTKIGFNNLNNEWVEFSSPLPQELKDFLSKVKK